MGLFILLRISAVVIVGVLTRIVWPYYLATTLKSGRSDAKVALNEVAQRMQRCFTASNNYAPSTAGDCVMFDTLKSSSGFVSEQGFYTVKRAATTDITTTTFLLTATAVSGKRQEKDVVCATMTLDQKGVRAATDSSGTVVTDCW